MHIEENYPFVFIDESGTSDSPKNPQPYFAVGFLKVDQPTQISKRLLNIWCNAKSRANHRRKSQDFRNKIISGKISEAELNHFLQVTRHHEYHFAEIKTEILEDYLKFIDAFFKYNFHFCAIIIDKKQIDSKHSGYWDSYVKITKLICDKNLQPNEKATVIADYMNAPKSSNLSIEKELPKLNNVNNVIRLQSNGVPLLQICDLFLGSVVFANKLANNLQDLHSDYSKAKNEIIKNITKKIGNNDLSTNFTYNKDNKCFSVWKIK